MALQAPTPESAPPPRFPDLSRVPRVDAVGVEERAAALAKRSIKKEAKRAGIRLAISMIDLTTLEGADTVGKVRSLCAKARVPDPLDAATPRPAAVCVYGDMVATAKQALGDSGIHVAAVATAFPSGRASMDVKLADTRGTQTVKGLDNLLRVKGGGAMPQDMDATVQSGALEGSNVNMTQTLVDMIENQRSYEVQANLMKEAKSLDENSASLMRLPS